MDIDLLVPPLTPAESALAADEVTTAQIGGAYAAFYEGVARRQLLGWLPADPSVVLDLSGAGGSYATEVAARGHTVVHVTGPTGAIPAPHPGLHVVHAEVQDLRWLRRGSYDAVLAESSTLSACLAFEESLHQLARALRPGGRLLLSVDSLVLGLARLAEQGRWAELADVPSADVVLVPGPDGQITRCFWPEELAAMLCAAGFDTHWIRPRTVLSEEAVSRMLASDSSRLEMLVHTETALERDRQGESIGYHLVASAIRR